MALLAPKYRVIAPDLPSFGFTVAPESRNYDYTFINFGKTIEAFVDALHLTKFAIYIFD
jgi:pimeloyl-ACP methyl ester carboxylesterase